MPELIFDEKEHIYTVGGVVVPSVTGILKDAGLVSDKWWNESARLRGTYVHKAIELHLNGGVDPDSIDSTVKPYFEAFLKFQKEVRPVVLSTEKRVYSENLKYAGTMDLEANIGEKKYIVDYKTGGISAWAAIQLAGYFIANKTDGPCLRAGLQLKANGSYSFVPYENQTDIHVFKSAVTLSHYKNGRL